MNAEKFTWSREALDMLHRPALGQTKSDLLSLMYYSADQEAAQHALKISTTKNKEFVTQFRLMLPNGEARWIAARGVPFYNQGRELIVGVFIDITEAEKAIAPQKDLVKDPKLRDKGAHRRSS
jgi:PAS domain-containing protein